MAEWLYEDGIGEARAALVEDGEIVEALIARDGAGARAGSVVPARLVRVIAPRRRALALLDTGEELLVEPIPPGVSEGQALLVEVTREALPEPGLDGVRPKRALGRVAPADSEPADAPPLRARIAATGIVVRDCHAHAPDLLEDHGWSALLEEASTGEVVREEAALRLYPTPAMMLIDVDGTAPAARLARAGARLAAGTIRRMGLSGSIGIDLPTMASKGERSAADAEIDAHLPPPFERTAVNGFGFVQIIRRRTRASLIELLRADPVESAALAALRAAERDGGGVGPVTIAAPLAVIQRIADNPCWTAALERRRGGALTLAASHIAAAGGAHVR